MWGSGGRGVPRLASLVAGALVLYGCATYPVEPTLEGRRGYIAVRLGRPGFVVAAPHGTSDPLVGDVASEIARRTGFGLVVATGFAVEPDTPHSPGRRYQVNRPYEGVPSWPLSQETATDDARRVYEAYEQRVREAAQGPVLFYVEVHGNNRREAAGRLEIATVGLDQDVALRFRALLELVRDAHLRAHPGAPRLEVRIEPADPIVYAASGAKRVGILRLPQRALHIELPRIARTDFRDVYTTILADFVGQAAALPQPR